MTGDLRDVFDSAQPMTLGLEEEVFLLEAGSLDLAPIASQLLEGSDTDALKLELPAAQVELVTPPRRSVAEAIADLAAARSELAQLCSGRAVPAALAVHPFAHAEGPLNPGERYAALEAEYGPVSRRQLVCALQIHVAFGDADVTLAVYNELRSHLPEIAALAAAAPFHLARDSGLASVRPTLAQLLPRQGMPPILESWEAFGEELRWGALSRAVPEPGNWWWELRPHVVHGTLEVRVPDVQPALADTAAIVAVVHSLCAWLAGRAQAGDLPEPAVTWRIEENSWSALRHGVEGEMADLRTGHREPTRERLHSLLDRLEPVARGLGCDDELAGARGLVEENSAMRLRACGDPTEATRWAAERFLAHSS
jgi:carboxylate-amine ligase